MTGSGAEAPADWEELESAETYLGYGRVAGFASAGELRQDLPRDYVVPSVLPRHTWALAGGWTIKLDRIAADSPGASLTTDFHARDLHLVIAPAEAGVSVRFRVSLDGHAPGDAHGLDVDAAGMGVVDEPRMYQLLRQPHPITDRTAEIAFPDGGAEAFVVTFG